MASKVTKRKLPKEVSKQEIGPVEIKLFVDAPPDDSNDDSDGAADSDDETDSSMSEESVYSDLEEESEEESEVESINDASSSDDEAEAGSSEEDDSDAGNKSDDGDKSHAPDDIPNGTSELSKTDVKAQRNTKASPVKSSRTQNKINNQKTLSTKSCEIIQINNSSPAMSRKAKRKLKKKAALNEDSAGTSKTTITPVSEISKEIIKMPSKMPVITGPDEYEFDSSDEEDIRNTVGNIPMEWYREFEHIGYDIEGKKIIKPAGGDKIDEFIDKMENPDYWRTIFDKSTGQKVILSDKDVETIQRLRRGRYVDPNYNPYEPWIDFFTHEVMKHPVTNRPEDKRSFIPSKWERQKVSRLVHSMKMGWYKPKKEKSEEEEQQERYYMLWKTDDQSEISKRYQHHIPAPKMTLPGHAESYNPPPEYLLTEEEELAWKEQDPEDRRVNFVPRKYSSLRRVPAYAKFINERFERCLDLYLCPRVRKTRMNIDPEDLIPKLPKPKDLRPFPTTQAIVYRGHTDIVRTVCCDSTGQWLVSGSDDEMVKFWEVSTGRCMKTLKLGGVVKKVVWNPNPAFCLVGVVVGDSVWIINPQLGDKLIQSNTDSIISGWEESEQDTSKKKVQVEWSDCEGLQFEEGYRLKVTHTKPVSHLSWHGRGDYFTVVIPDAQSQSVLIHQLSKRRTQNPFSKPKGLVQCVLFHPSRPLIFIATQRYVRVYNLLKQELVKKLLTNAKWVSSMAVHPGGDNVIVGSYDSRLSWFDLDLSTKPYQTLRHHRKAVRAVSYHAKYPLFASASDDGTVIVCHGMVYNDLLQNPLIVPVKVLRGHGQCKNLGVLDCTFHPTQPWVFSSGADATVRLYT